MRHMRLAWYKSFCNDIFSILPYLFSSLFFSLSFESVIYIFKNSWQTPFVADIILVRVTIENELVIVFINSIICKVHA